MQQDDQGHQNETAPTRLLLVDDHALVRDLVAAHLAAQGFVIDTAASLAEARTALVGAGPYDLVLLDFALPDCSGLPDSATLIPLAQERPVVLFSGQAKTATVAEALEIGFSGFIPKSTAAQALAQALRQVLAGDVWLPEGLDLSRHGTDLPAPLASLTRREREVLRAIRAGRLNKEIAGELNISEVTVKMHVRAVCQKLGARNRTQAALIAAGAML